MLGLEDDLAFKAGSFFSGGMVCTGAFCGALTGGLMILGMVYGRANPRYGSVHDGSGAGLKLFKWFEREYGTTSCSELTGVANMLDKEQRAKFAVSEAHEKCFQRSGEVAAKVVEIIGEQGARMVSLEEAIAELKKQGLL